MKLLISNQHGAIVMALLPFLYGLFSSQPVWQHLFLFFRLGGTLSHDIPVLKFV